MRNEAWISLLQQLPPEYQAKLVLVCASGHEINLQSVFRFDADFLIFRGRLAGTTEAGTFVFLPYDQIVYIGFREEIKENQLQEILGAPSEAPAAASTPEAEPPPRPAPAPRPAAAPEPAPAPVSMPTTAGAPPLPGKAALLERLRRSRAQGPGADAKPS
jgi:hypothetical protein